MLQLSSSTDTEVDPVVFNVFEEVEHSLRASTNVLMHSVDSGAVGRPSLVLPLYCPVCQSVTLRLFLGLVKEQFTAEWQIMEYGECICLASPYY